MSEPVTTQPKSGDTLTVELPELDFHHMVKGEWKVGNFEVRYNFNWRWKDPCKNV